MSSKSFNFNRILLGCHDEILNTSLNSVVMLPLFVYSGIVANIYTAKAPKRNGIDHAANTGGMMPAYPIEREKVKPSQ